MYKRQFHGGGTVATVDAQSNIVLTDAYIAHVNEILDKADDHGMKVGLVVAWQNLYLPGGGADPGNPVSNTVRGTVTEDNSYAYGRQMVDAFGDHPAVSMWVFGGDAGTNNTEANKQVWRNMADGVRDAGSTLDITYHTPTSPFDQLNYAGEPWLDFIAPETGHAQTPAETESELIAAANAYQLPVWQGEPRYFNINFTWVREAFRNPGVAEVEADAIAARNAGVAGYVYGDAGRWNWCGGFGDSSPCQRSNIAASFGAGEQAVIDVFRDGTSGVTPPTTTTPATPDGTTLFSVDARGFAGTEVLTVTVDGSSAGTLSFGTAASTESLQLPGGASWEDIRLGFAGSAGRDLDIDSFTLGGDVRGMVAGDVLVSGQWTGSECSPLGDPIHSVLHCTAVVEFPADDAPVAPADTTPPTVSLTSPTTIEPAEVTLTGVFADSASGVESVGVTISRISDSPIQNWNGAGWAAGASAMTLQATIDGSGAWALPGVDLTVGATYEVAIQATDAAGNVSPLVVQTIVAEEPDLDPPVVASVTPVDGTAVAAGPVDVVAQVSDTSSGVDRVRIFVRKASTGEYWDGDAWVAGWSWVLATPDDTGSWTIPSVDASDPGRYSVLVWAWDAAENLASWNDNPQSKFVVDAPDLDAPVVASVTPVDGTAVAAGPVDVVAQVSDTSSGVDRVRIFVRKASTGEYWDGDAWVAGWSWVLAAPDGNGAWMLPGVDVSDVDAYQVLVWAWDTEDNLARWNDNPRSTFSATAPVVDLDAPVVSSIAPADSAAVTTGFVDVVADVSDTGSGVDRVRLFVRKNSTGEFWDGSAWVSNWSWVLGTADGAGAWTVPKVDVSDSGSYRVLVWAWDTEGNLANFSVNPQSLFTT